MNRYATRLPWFALATCALLVVSPARAQSVLGQTPNLGGSWTAIPAELYLRLPARFTTLAVPGPALDTMVTYGAAVGLPFDLAVGGRYSPTSGVMADKLGEWELYARWLPIQQDRGAPLDVGLQGGFNGTAGSADGELLLERAFGPLRLMAVGRAMSDAFDLEEAGWAAGAGAVLLPFSAVPVALAGDALWLFAPDLDDRLAWSAGLQLGLPLTPFTVSLQVGNTQTTTLQGSSRPTDDLWVGIELAFSLPTGRYLGVYPLEGTSPGPATAGPRVVEVEFDDYAFHPARLVLERGTTVVWTNRDSVEHTVSADDRSFHSELIPPGGTFRQTFNVPGTYPYHCGPHPFMTGVVTVR